MDRTGATPLLLCSASSSVSSSTKAVKLLCNAGANVNLKTIEGRTPLHEASVESISNSNIKTIKILLKNGADVNAQDNEGFTPLHLSSRYLGETSDYNTVKLLLDAGALINIDNNDKCTALHYSIAAYISNKKKTQHLRKKYNDSSYEILQAIDLLIQSGANLNHQDFDGFTPTYYAAYFGSLVHDNILLKKLIDAGADINIKNNEGKSPLDKCKETYLDHFYLGWNKTFNRKWCHNRKPE